MNQVDIAEAIGMLHKILEKQPSLIAPRQATESSGKDVADFCLGFIKQYSEGLEGLAKYPSQP